MMYKLLNGKLITPPVTGVRHNGKVVSGYNMLSESELREDGWKDKQVDVAPEEIPEGYEAVWFYEEDSTTIYYRCRLEQLPEPEVVEEA